MKEAVKNVVSDLNGESIEGMRLRQKIADEYKSLISKTGNKAEIDSANAARLDTGYVIFGQVISDLEVIKQLGRKPVNFNSDIPRNPIYFNIDTVTVSQTFLIDSIGYNIDTLMIPQQ